MDCIQCYEATFCIKLIEKWFFYPTMPAKLGNNNLSLVIEKDKRSATAGFTP